MGCIIGSDYEWDFIFERFHYFCQFHRFFHSAVSPCPTKSEDRVNRVIISIINVLLGSCTVSHSEAILAELITGYFTLNIAEQPGGQSLRPIDWEPVIASPVHPKQKMAAKLS